MLLNRSNKAKAAAMHGFDGVLGPAAISHGLPCRHNAGTQRRFTNKLAWPQTLKQLLLEDHAITVRHKVCKHIIHFGPKPDPHPVTAQFIALRVEGMIAKDVKHYQPSPASSPKPHQNAIKEFPRNYQETIKLSTCFRGSLPSEDLNHQSKRAVGRTSMTLPIHEMSSSARGWSTHGTYDQRSSHIDLSGDHQREMLVKRGAN